MKDTKIESFIRWGCLAVGFVSAFVLEAVGSALAAGVLIGVLVALHVKKHLRFKAHQAAEKLESLEKGFQETVRGLMSSQVGGYSSAGSEWRRSESDVYRLVHEIYSELAADVKEGTAAQWQTSGSWAHLEKAGGKSLPDSSSEAFDIEVMVSKRAEEEPEQWTKARRIFQKSGSSGQGLGVH